MPRYLLDTNVFVYPKRTYGFKACQGFWKWLDTKNKIDRVFSIMKVYDELQGWNDELAKWARVGNRQREFFIAPDSLVFAEYSLVADWARANQNYTGRAVNNFLGGVNPTGVGGGSVGADSWLVAYALAYGYIVVTHETPGIRAAPNQEIHRIKIPDVCAHFNIACICPKTMLRREHANVALDRFCTLGTMPGETIQ